MPVDLSAASAPALAAVAAAFVVTTIVFLVLWLRARATARPDRRSAPAPDVARLELEVAEQGGRLRIIRELHDVTVHRISTIVAQADGARYAAGDDPGAVARAAATIAETGRSTLADLRRVMTLVREGDEGLTAQPRLRSLRELFAVQSDAGLAVSFGETGEPFDLDAGGELAVYRIVQEALDNALRYGGEGTETRVWFTWTPAGLAVRVDDNGFRNLVARKGLPKELADAELAYGVADDVRSLTQQIVGGGILEMRARAEAYGGMLTATEVPGVGFSIAATFPAIRHHNGIHGVDLSRAAS